MSPGIQNSLAEWAEIEPGLRAVLGPPPGLEYEIRVHFGVGRSVSRGYEYPFSTHTFVRPNSIRSDATNRTNLGGQNVKGPGGAPFCPRVICADEPTAISVTACDDAISASVDHKLAAAFCIPNTVEGPNDVAYD
jgi:hypothetical protein